MKTIYKYEISPLHTAIEMPKGAELLSVKTQNNTPCLWALVDTDQPPEDRFLVVFGTGHPVVNHGKYLGTFLIENDSLVFHVFEDATYTTSTTEERN